MFAEKLRAMSHNRLADEIERLNERADKISAPIWNAALSDRERWLDIIERLGPNDKRVERYNDIRAKIDAAYYEAKRRYGPISFNSLYPIGLRSLAQKRVA